MYLITGLGNPGPRYAGTRHNIGFMAVDAIARVHGFGHFTQRFGGEVCEGKIAQERVFLQKPQTYMNESGRAVGELARFYKIPVENIIVLHDELDVAFARLRVKRGGGNGGHNGLKSIDAHLGADYWRVRLGIGHPGDRELVTPHVLSDFSKPEQAALAPWLDAVAAHIPLLLAGREAGFMNKVVLSQP